jgi:hypothetical protein
LRLRFVNLRASVALLADLIVMGKSKAGGKQPSSSVPTPHIWGKHHIEPLFWDIAGPKIRHSSNMRV